MWRAPQSAMKPVMVVTAWEHGLFAASEDGFLYWGGEPRHQTALDMTERAISRAVYEELIGDEVLGREVTVEIADAIAKRLRQRLRGIVEMPDL